MLVKFPPELCHAYPREILP